MQRVVSGEDICDRSEYGPSSDHFQNDATMTLESDNINININSSIMPDSPCVAFHDATNLVENDEECGSVNATNENDNDTDAMTNLDGIDAASNLDSSQSTADPQRSSSVPSSSVPINGSGDASDSTTASTSTSPNYQHQHTSLSIIGGLLPAVGLRPMTRNDSRYSGTTSSLASGMQRSQNSSRDWGWFEDVHHSDIASVATGGEISRAASRSHTNKASGIGSSSGASQQQTLTGTRNTNNLSLHSSGGNSTKNNSGEGTMGGTNSLTVTDSSNGSGNSNSNKTVIEGGTIGLSDSSFNRGEQRDSISQQNPVSLLPRGEEMFIDDMEEYLEPFLIHERPRDMENEAAVNANSAPTYVLEESISDQLLWKETAGNRPPQPVEERAYFEAMWAKNFANSEVEYEMPTEVLTATTPLSLNPFDDGNFGTGGTGVIGAGVAAKQDVTDIVSSFVVPGGINASGHASGQQNSHLPNPHNKPSIVRNSSGRGNLTVYAKGDNVFGTTVSKSFARPSVNGELVMGVDTVNISVASYRVVESEKRGRHAQFLVIYREGGVRDTIGVWKRYSDFQELSKKVTNINEGCASVIANMSPLAVTEEPDVEHLPNAITSWHLLKKRKRWYRCLDSGYLSLKAFLLERFLHDILFESSTPDLLRDFVGVPPPR